MRWFKRDKEVVVKEDKFKAGDKVFVVCFVKVYRGKIVQKDTSYDFMFPNATRWIVEISGVNQSVLESMLAKQEQVEELKGGEG